MKGLIAYALSADDNDSWMMGDETRKAASPEERQFYDWRFMQFGQPHPATCPKCGAKTDPRYVDPYFKLMKKKLDVGSTYDGYLIVSERFKQLCERLQLAGAEWVSLPSQPTHYWFVVRNVIEVDTELSVGIRFQKRCDECNRFSGVFGTSGVKFKGVESPISRGIFRSDIEFGQAHEQSPMFVIGTETALAMKREKLRGLWLKKVEYT